MLSCHRHQERTYRPQIERFFGEHNARNHRISANWSNTHGLQDYTIVSGPNSLFSLTTGTRSTPLHGTMLKCFVLSAKRREGNIILYTVGYTSIALFTSRTALQIR